VAIVHLAQSLPVDTLISLSSGLIAGLALATPLGAIGVLLIQEGVIRGLRAGLLGAAAVATVDVVYCFAAVTAGTLAGPIVRSWTPWSQLLGGTALIALGVHGLVKSRPTREQAVDQTSNRPATALRRYSLFLGLTALNPATLVYFAAIVSGLDRVAESIPTTSTFVAGVGVASFGWQTLLVALGALLRRQTGPSFQRWTTAMGNGLIIALGAVLIGQILW